MLYENMRHLDLFSGIGGFALAVDTVWPGAEHIFCDNDPFCQVILKKHWPKSKIYGDIRGFVQPRIPIEIDLLTGGFPCQPFSHAGQRRGTLDDRHLWPEMYRVIREFRPHFVVAENVRGLLSIDGGLVFEQVCTDLEAISYEVQAFVIPACAVNAPHRRDRIWIVARDTKHDGPNGTKNGQGGRARSDSHQARQKKVCESAGSVASRNNAADDALLWEGGVKKRSGQCGFCDRDECNQGANWSEDWPAVAARLCTLDDGLPNGLARPRGWRNAALKAAGNAIVPQVAIEILKTIKLCHSPSKT